MNRFRLLIIAIVVVVVAWTVGWFYFASRVEAEVARLAQADGITTPRVECSELSVGGYPFQFRPLCQGVAIAAGDYAITLDALEASALFYNPMHVQLAARGPATIADTFNGTSQEVRWSDLRASGRLDDGRIARVSVVGTDVAIYDTLMGETLMGQADEAQFHLLDNPKAFDAATGAATLEVYLDLEGTQIPSADIAQGILTVDGEVTGVPQMGLWAHPQLPRLWQSANGTLTLRGFEAQAQDLSLSAQGQARLNPAGQVEGTLSLVAQGIVERLGPMGTTPLAKLVTGEADAEGTYTRDIEVRDGTIYVGMLPVQTIPPLF